MTEEVKAVSYCVGMSIAGSLMEQNLGGIDPSTLAEAIRDAFQGKELKYTPEMANTIIQNYLQAAAEQEFAQNRAAGEAFLHENGAKEGVHLEQH
jgi:FKBP-type peptidyl-prolyl cis-trans isomerase FklB